MSTNGNALLPSRSDLVALAAALAEADQKLRTSLVAARKEAGLTQAELAELLGIKQSSVAAFERYDNDPRLSTIRRYALAVGAQVEHQVVSRVFSRSDRGDWTALPSAGFSAGVQHSHPQVPVAAPPSASRREHFAMAA